jgi:peptidoglycan-associated lipoprotein
MKRLLILLLPLLILGLVIGCGKKPEVEPEERPTDITERPDVDQEPVDTLEDDGIDREPVDAFKTIYFDFDKYNLRPDAKAGLQHNVDVMKENPGWRVLIEGHCDERGTVEYNLALGERRARSARDYMVSMGVDPDRIEIISYGKERPVDPGHNEAAWAKNRRCEFVKIS